MASPARRRLRSWIQRAVSKAAMRTVMESNHTSPRPLMVAQALCPKPTRMPSAIGVSMCRRVSVFVRHAIFSEAQARRKKSLPP